MAYLLAGWDFARFTGGSTFNIDVTPSGGVAQTITKTSGTYAHRDLSSVMGTGEYTDIATWLKTALDALAPARVYTVTWAAATGYTLSVGGGATFAIDFNTPRSRLILGFSGNLTTAASHVSTQTPYYYLALAREGLSQYTRPFERDGQTKRGVSVNASAYSIGPTTYEQGIKGVARFQSVGTVFNSDATVPFVYESFVQHVRCHEPVAVAIGPSASPTTTFVTKFLRGEFDEQSRKPVFNDYHGKWDLPLDLQYLGAI